MKPNAKISAVIFTITLLAPLVSVEAKPRCRKQPIKTLVEAFAESFSNKTMGTLDADRPYVGRFTIRIEHSLADDDDPQRFEVRRFPSFTRAEQWFKSREIEGLPGRYTRPVENCARGVCSYNTEGGINHRSLYLTKITYGVRPRLSLYQNDLRTGWRLKHVSDPKHFRSRVSGVLSDTGR